MCPCPQSLQKKRSSQTPAAKSASAATTPFDFRAALLNEPYRSTTAYPHPHPPRNSNDDLGALGFGPAAGTSAAAADPNTDPFNAGPYSLGYLLPLLPSVLGAPPTAAGATPGAPRPCEVHTNTFHPGGSGGMGPPPPPGPPPHGYQGAAGLNLARGCETLEHACTRLFCCGSRGILARFPSRAKRIDVISRFIFPLIFAIFNLAYWLYYLFAKSKSPQLEG